MTTAAPRTGSSRRPGGAPAIDPRIRQRRITVRRDAGRRRLRRVVVLVVVVVVLAGLVGLTRSPLLAVRHLRIEGATQTSAAAIARATGIAVGSPIVEVSAASARRGVADLPWIKTVSVRRSFPNTVVVRVTERTPVATVHDGSAGWLEVDASGRVLTRVATRPAALTEITGVGSAARPGQTLHLPASVLALAAAMPASLRPSVASASTGSAGLQLTLHAGGIVRVGDASDLSAKLIAAQAVLTSQGVRPECVAVLDVAVAAAPALTTRAGCA